MSEREDIQEAWLRNQKAVCTNCDKWKSLAGELKKALVTYAKCRCDGPGMRESIFKCGYCEVLTKAREMGLP